MSIQQEDRAVGRALHDSSNADAAAAFQNVGGASTQPRNRNRGRRLIRAQSPSREPGATMNSISGPGTHTVHSPPTNRISPNVTSNLLALSSEASLPTVDFLASPGGLAAAVGDGPGGAAGPGSVLYASSSRPDGSGNNESKFPLWQN